MATLEKKHNSSIPDFDIADCHKIIEIYEETKKQNVSRTINTTAMLHELRTANGLYMFRKIKRKAPTPTQLKKQHIAFRNKARKLLVGLQEETDTHFLNSLVCAMAGTKSPLNIDEETYKLLLEDVYKNLRSMEAPLKWLLEQLDLSTADQFHYLHTDPDSEGRASAENDFIRNLSFVLTKYLGSGGRTNDDYDPKNHRGWKTVSIEYLLKRVGITCTRSQITGAMSTKKPKKTVNKTSK